MLNLKNHKIFLASKSPRRSELLAQAGIPFEIFERASELKEVGAGIGLLANAVKILNQ